MILQLSVASASEIEVTMHLSNSELYKPEEVTVFIRLTNIANDKLESVELLDYLERPIVTFGKTSLEPYESIEWVGTWLVTEEQLITEKLAFTCRYSVVDSKGKTQKALRFVKPIKNNNAIISVLLFVISIYSLTAQHYFDFSYNFILLDYI